MGWLLREVPAHCLGCRGHREHLPTNHLTAIGQAEDRRSGPDRPVDNRARLAGFPSSIPFDRYRAGVTDRAVNLIEESVDCVLRVGALTDSGLIARQIGRLPLINVGSPAYFAAHGTPFAPDDLSQHWAINYASPSTGRIESWEWLENDTVRSMSMRARVTVNSAEAYIACCLAGMGLIQIPAYDVRDHLQNGALIEVMPDYRAQSCPWRCSIHTGSTSPIVCRSS